MFENAQLQNKLENLENVFIGSSIGRDGKNQSAASRNVPKDGLQQDYATQNLMIENNDLKKRIFVLEQEKIELSQNLSQSLMSQSGQNNMNRQVQQNINQSDMQEMYMI